MKKIIRELKERGIDKQLQEVIDFAKVAGLNTNNSYEKALKLIFMQMIEGEGEDFETDFMNCVIDEGLGVLLKELNLKPSEGTEVDNELKTLLSGLCKLRDLLRKESK